MIESERTPFEFTSSNDMHMQMEYRLQSVGPVIDEHTITIIGESLETGDFGGGKHEMTEQVLVGVLGEGHHGDATPGDDQKVDGGLGVNVTKGEHVLVLVDHIGGDLAREDLVEDGGRRQVDGGWCRRIGRGGRCCGVRHVDEASGSKSGDGGGCCG